MKNFSISLYAFHLCHTFTDAPDSATDGAENLWENLAKLGEGSLPFSELKNLRQKLICYQNGRYEPEQEKGRQTEWLTDSGCLDLGSIPTADGFKIKANIQPFRLNDTYAADFTLWPESPTIEIDIPKLRLFKPSCLLPSQIKASLGQTLWIYGEVDKTEAQCEIFAKEWAEALLEGTSLNPVLVNKDKDKNKLLGSLIFEYQVIDPNDPNNITNQCHILISLNNIRAGTVKLTGDAYDWLLNLLCCRHKIFYIYQQARDRHPAARTIYSKLEQEIKNFHTTIAAPKTRLDSLQELLTKMPSDYLEFTRCIGDLKFHKTAINTNLKNYNICLERIAVIGDRPKIWEDFYHRIRDQWQSQIQIDIDYLSSGKDVFEQTISTIRGIVEIDQAESDRALVKVEKDSDRNLQIVVAVVGVGIGAAGVAATASPYIFEAKPNQEFTIIPVRLQPSFGLNPPHHLTRSVLFSLGAGLVGVAIAARMMRYIQKHPKSAIARTINLILGSSQEEEIRITELPNSQSPELLLSQQQEKERSHTFKNS